MNINEMTNTEIQAAIDEMQTRIKLLKKLKKVQQRLAQAESEINEPIVTEVQPADPWQGDVEVEASQPEPAHSPVLYLLPPAKNESQDAFDYASLPTRKLRGILGEKGVKNASRMTKNQMLEALQAA